MIVFIQVIARYPLNPEKFWGPKARATGSKKRKVQDAKISTNNDDTDNNTQVKTLINIYTL